MLSKQVHEVEDGLKIDSGVPREFRVVSHVCVMSACDVICCCTGHGDRLLHTSRQAHGSKEEAR